MSKIKHAVITQEYTWNGMKTSTFLKKKKKKKKQYQQQLGDEAVIVPL